MQFVEDHVGLGGHYDGLDGMHEYYMDAQLGHPVDIGGMRHFVTRGKRGIHRVVNFRSNIPQHNPQKHKVWNGYAVQNNKRVFIVNGNTMREPQTPQEKAAAQRYLQEARKVRGGRGNRPVGVRGNRNGGGGGAGKRGPYIAPSKYTPTYNSIRSKLGPLLNLSKKDDAVWKGINEPPIQNQALMEKVTAFVNDLMDKREFFVDRDSHYVPALPLQYVAGNYNLANVNFGGKPPPDYLTKFNAVAHNSSSEAPKEKFKAVYDFYSKLQSSMRAAINFHANKKDKEKSSKQFAENVANKFNVPKGDAKTVIKEAVSKIMTMSDEELSKLSLKEGMSRPILLEMVLESAGIGIVADASGLTPASSSLATEALSVDGSSRASPNITWLNFSEHFAKTNHKMYKFIMSHEAGFKKAIKAANRVLYRRKKAAEKGHEGKHKAGMPDPALVQAGASASGIASMLVSMRSEL